LGFIIGISLHVDMSSDFGVWLPSFEIEPGDVTLWIGFDCEAKDHMAV